ncbi:hypothetical protein PoB_002492200 [Plakobranchus ocellatus]|uniref:Uncharacterized protein n=1 Tax=Plakobranchus ocellatus TaxID=259542 RepID=A0AAV3ZTF5_9GAST|nr:hypothetical protein PoB_002492200 [Plakobranchus ocellatus]
MGGGSSLSFEISPLREGIHWRKILALMRQPAYPREGKLKIGGLTTSFQAKRRKIVYERETPDKKTNAGEMLEDTLSNPKHRPTLEALRHVIADKTD